jgi:hypothetical protein
MSHNLFAVFPLPVVLAFAALVLLLLAIGRVLGEMGKPVPVLVPVRASWRDLSAPAAAQMLQVRNVAEDGVVPGSDPDATHPDREARLFCV